MKDKLGDRIKSFYEERSKTFLPRRTFSIIRIDGKAFHTYTRGLEKPYDKQLMSDMDETAKFLCENIQGAKMAYVQSDEISILITDFDKLTTDAWFDNNVQKMVSISASLATAKFNELRPGKLAFFDSRVFTIPYVGEVMNYFIWRQQDAVRNSISMLAQNYFSHKKLHGKKTSDMLDMLKEIDKPWDDEDFGFKYGRTILKKEMEINGALRNKWVCDEVEKFNETHFSQFKIV
jgi:tRNA(His) guanylyltransferase